MMRKGKALSMVSQKSHVSLAVLVLWNLFQTGLALESSSVKIASDAIASQQIQELKDRAWREHDVQFEIGSKVFGSSASVRLEGASSVDSFDDKDFRTYDVGRTNFGPVTDPSQFSNHCHLLYETLEPVMTPEDCEFFIDAARKSISQGRAAESQDTPAADQDENGRDRTNSELGEVRLSALPPDALERLRTVLRQKLYPLLESRFGDKNDLTLYDGLILGSIAPATSQPVHRDASLLTLNIPLSAPEEFSGGGTYVEPLGDGFAAPLRIDQGKALCHLSGVRHAGTAITAGQRWVLVMFLLAKEEPQIARRCHADGLSAIDDKDLESARSFFLTGLSESPSDHLLHMGLGSIASIQGDRRQAYKCLDRAGGCYPLDRKVTLSKGNMLLAQNRPRAALRQFERLLHEMGDRDQTTQWMPLKALAWETRISAARASLLCAEREAASSSGATERPWAMARLPSAIVWLQMSLIPAPHDTRLHALLSRAEELLNAAKYLNHPSMNVAKGSGGND